jgi:N-acetylglucosaminyldiphosphoundecaprenol N-acetyl-beta-D-mannosaminyltransferase
MKRAEAQSGSAAAKPGKGLGITHYTREGAREALRQHFASFIPLQVVTLTPEMCVRANGDPEFDSIIRNAGMVVADGIGVVWGESRLSGRRPDKIPGIELATWALEEVDRLAGRVYLLGARPEVVGKTAKRLSGDFPRLALAGFHDGYFAEKDENSIVGAISETQSHLVLVGMGSPKQEMFIARHLSELKCAVAMGIGGSFDVWSGHVRRAPALFRATHTEWLYRIFTQPGERLKRVPALFRFIGQILFPGHSDRTYTPPQ